MIEVKVAQIGTQLHMVATGDQFFSTPEDFILPLSDVID